MNNSGHTFHIPVLGLGYSIDTPVKVAKYGISSVVSIIEDNLIEQMREFYCHKENLPYIPFRKSDPDFRANRITAYLNLIGDIVTRQIESLKSQPFDEGSEIVRYFNMLPNDSLLRKRFRAMLKEGNPEMRLAMQDELRKWITPGAIDVNIMTKCDRLNFDESGEPLSVEYADAMAALRGYANSNLESSVVFSAGMNPRLYSYCESFSDFKADVNGNFRKKIILKVSDFRSALIQGKFLARKGLWVSEFRIESGLNCGGHAFPTDGYLIGPILEEFKNRRKELSNELFELYKTTITAKNLPLPLSEPPMRISVQGGIGTWNEHKFLLDHYQVDSTGWGSPFLLVPEATNVDDATLNSLSNAKPDDFYLSHASPLGVPFNNFRGSTSIKQRDERIEKGRPGSPCYKQFLAFNTEFSDKPICTASREYQNLKLKQIGIQNNNPIPGQIQEFKAITEKECLCEGLSSAVLIKNNIPVHHNLSAVSVCPGPNLAYFSGVFTLNQMIDHIYGRINILNRLDRPSVFIKELMLYVDYLKKEFGNTMTVLGSKQKAIVDEFKRNLINGIDYYVNLLSEIKYESEAYLSKMRHELCLIKTEIMGDAVQLS